MITTTGDDKVVNCIGLYFGKPSPKPEGRTSNLTFVVHQPMLPIMTIGPEGETVDITAWRTGEVSVWSCGPSSSTGPHSIQPSGKLIYIYDDEVLTSAPRIV